MKTVTILEPQSNDSWGPYYKCPNCGGENITRTFQRCIDCGAWIIWKKVEIRTLKEMGIGG